MTKLVLTLTAVLFAATPSAARADDAAKRAEAQKKVDDAKIKVCEGVKTFLAKQSKRCPDQAAAAAKVTCTAATFAEANALNAACAKAPAAPRSRTCKISDETGAAVSDSTGATFLGCMKDAKAAAKARCAPGVKKVKLSYQFADRKPLTSTALCPK